MGRSTPNPPQGYEAVTPADLAPQCGPGGLWLSNGTVCREIVCPPYAPPQHAAEYPEGVLPLGHEGEVKPKPTTQNPQPQNLYPKHQTLNPRISTLNPKP